MSAEPPVGDGLLIVDKPAGWTSHDVVGRVRRLCRTRRVGHAGTLDPMATGVLVLGVNRGTKLLTFLVGHDKGYAATIRLGQATLTDDAEGEVTGGADAGHLTNDQIARALATLTGDIQQVPSAVSAIKIDGRRSYARVRGGEDVALPPRPVTVSRFTVLDRRDVPGCGPDTGDAPGGGEASGGGGASGGAAPRHAVVDLDVEVEVSSGTYVRALARDLGEALGVGGHLTALRRTRVGDLGLDAAVTLDQLDPEQGPGPTAYLVDLATAARAAMPSRELTEPEARALGYGQRILAEQPGRVDPVAAIGPDGRLVAVLDESREREPLVRALVVFTPAGGS